MSDSVKNIRANVYLNDKSAGKSLRGLESDAKKLNNQLRHMDTNSKEYQQTLAKLQAKRRLLNDHRQQIRGVESGWARAANNFNKYWGLILAGIAAAGGLVFGFRELVKAFTDFEKGITNVYTLLSQDVFERYHKELEYGAKQVMKDYGFAQEDVNKALFDAISAGVPAGKAIEFLNTSAILAVGGVTTLAVATDGLTSVLNAYKLDIGETTNVADAFFSAQKEGKTTVELLASTIGKAAPIAANLGVSYQELLSAIATLTKGGISTAESVTYLRGAMVALQKPTTLTTELFEKEFGHGLGVSEIKARGFGAVIEELSLLMDRYPDEIAAAIPNIRAFTGITALSGKGQEEYLRILQLVQNDIGKQSSLTQAFNRQQETSAQYLARARAELDTYRIALGEKLQPIMGLIVFKTSKLIKLLVELPKWWAENKEWVYLFVGALALYNQALLLATVRKWELVAAERMALVQQKLNVLWTNAQVTAQALYITGTNLLNGRITTATALQRAYNIVLASNPIGLVVASVMLLIGALTLYEKYSARSIDLGKQEASIKNELAAANEKLKETEQDLAILMKAYQEASKEERLEIRKLIAHKQEELRARLAVIKAKRDEIGATASELTASQKLWLGIKASLAGTGGMITAASEAAIQRAKNSAEATGEYDQAILTLENDINELGESLKQLDEVDKQTTEARLERAKQAAQERLNAEKQIQEFLNGLSDTELSKAQRKFDELLELAKKYGIDRVELEKAIDSELRRIRYEGIETDAQAEYERELELMQNSLQQLWEYEQAQLMAQDDWAKLSKEAQDEALYNLEVAHLNRVLEARKALGAETTAVEKQISDLKAAETKRRVKLNDDEEKSLRRSAAASAFNAAAQAQNAEEAKNAVLNSIRAEIQGYLAKAIAGAIATEIGTKGLLGLITGATVAGTAGALFNTLIPSFASGGYTSGTGLGVPDPEVPGKRFAGVTHMNEYVVAEEELAQPDISEMVRYIESTRRTRRGEGVGTIAQNTVTNNNQTIEVDGLVKVTMALASELKALREGGITAVADDRFRRDMELMKQKDDFIKSKSTLE